MNDRKLRYAEAAAFLGISQAMLRKLVFEKKHAPPYYRLGPRTVVFAEADLRDWMEARRVGVVSRP